MSAQDDFDYWLGGGVFDHVADRYAAMKETIGNSFSEATCGPGSRSEAFFEQTSDLLAAPFLWPAVAADYAEQGYYYAADSVSDGINWLAESFPPQEPHPQSMIVPMSWKEF